jgi:uncharacterized SAM-binding protein YcdF (DUF218 family)
LRRWHVHVHNIKKNKSDMEFHIVKFIESIIFPPAIVVLLLLAGLIVLPVRRRAGYLLSVFALLLLYLFSIPLVSSGLMSLNEPYPALTEEQLETQQAQAIVVLAAGRERDAKEYGGDTVGTLTLQRIRYAAFLQRRTHLPIIVSGGKPEGDVRSMADLMRQSLEQDFDVSVEAQEDQSKTTYENALFTSSLLKEQGYKRILLVTHAWHMPRSVEAFQHFGIEVIPAPTAFAGYGNWRFELSDIMPGSQALHYSFWALHELFGRWWYRLRYYD